MQWPRGVLTESQEAGNQNLWKLCLPPLAIDLGRGPADCGLGPLSTIPIFVPDLLNLSDNSMNWLWPCVILRSLPKGARAPQQDPIGHNSS